MLELRRGVAAAVLHVNRRMWTQAQDDIIGPKKTPLLEPARTSERRRAQPRERRSSEARDGLAQARGLLATAEAFVRAFDFTAAVASARDAAALLARLPGDRDVGVADLAAEVDVERKRFDSYEAAWRREVEARNAAYVAREHAEANGHLA